jgi:hypothetical protein
MPENVEWMKRGYEAAHKEQDRIEQMYGPNRFWMPTNSSKEFVFLDDEPVGLHEHNPKLNGKWDNWFTCLQGMSGEGPVCCEILGQDYRRYYVGYFSVVDLSKYTDKKGNTYQYEVKLLPAKLGTVKKFERKKKDKGTLVGTIYKASRDSDKDPSVGGEFEYVRDADLTKLFDAANYKGKKLSELWSKAESSPDELKKLQRIFSIQPEKGTQLPKRIVPFNYYELLKPRAASEIRTMFAGVRFDRKDSEAGDASEPSGGGSSSGAADNDVPF